MASFSGTTGKRNNPVRPAQAGIQKDWLVVEIPLYSQWER